MVRPHLVESSYCKILVPLKGTSILNHFLHKKDVFFNSCCYTKKNSKNTETLKYFSREGAVRPLGKRGNVTSIHKGINIKGVIKLFRGRPGETSFSGMWLLQNLVFTNRCVRHTPFPTRKVFFETIFYKKNIFDSCYYINEN